MEILENVLNTFQKVIDRVEFLKGVGTEVGCDQDLSEKLDYFISTLNNSKDSLSRYEEIIPIHYLSNLDNQLINLDYNNPYREYTDFSFINSYSRNDIKEQLEQIVNNLNNLIELIGFNLDFFFKLKFLSTNMVAIGANGSGKSSLSEYLKNSLGENGVVISAQKILILPTFSGISNHQNTIAKLGNYQNRYNNFRGTYSTEGGGTAYSLLSEVGGEFHILLDNLLAERSSLRNQFCDSLQANSNTPLSVPESTLDKVLNIWNSLIQHRTLICDDGVNISLKINDTQQRYAAYLMSDGEKVALYLIAHILQAPKNSFIVIDEPEMYLHKTILNKLWDTLEQERNDCIFMYLTHDLDFASTRYSAKKLWIKSFTYPDKWEIESIPDNEKLPETLLFELLGSRKNILFCEGISGSIDESIYNTIFPNLTIKPVGTCQSVINYTKAFNSLSNITTKAFGLIDSDHTPPSRLESLARSNIFSLKVAEAENLFFDEDFLKLIGDTFMVENIDLAIINIKNDIINLLNSNIEQQASNYVTTKIDYYFKDSNLSNGMTLDKIEENFSNFIQDINIKKDYEERIIFLKKISESNNYNEILRCFNNKGLQKIPERVFSIGKFKEKSIKFLKHNNDAKLCIRKYFDPILTENGQY